VFGNKTQAWEAWQISQAYNRPPSDIFDVKGAVGLFFDKGIFFFGRYVEAAVEEAGRDALTPGFARSAQQRAFARCMGEDMTKSAVGFANPVVGAKVQTKKGVEEEIISSGY
jgi:hypothetical protein